MRLTCLSVVTLGCALASLSGSQPLSSRVLDLYQEADQLRSGTSTSVPEFDRLATAFEQYRQADEGRQAVTRFAFVHGLVDLNGSHSDIQEAVLGRLFYQIVRLPDRNEAISLIADLFTYCPIVSTLKFRYTAPLDRSPDDAGTLVEALTEGVYLDPRPQPMDENPRLFEKEFEILPWDAASLHALELQIRLQNQQRSGNARQI